MLPFPSWPELRRRLPRCGLGLALFALGLGLAIRAHLGLSPWDVFHQGLAKRVGLQIGTVAIVVGAVVLLAWIPLRQRIGIGTIGNTVLVGLMLNVMLDRVGDFDGLVLRWAALAVGTVIIAIGSGLYIGSGLGPGPRDGVMMGLSSRGFSVAWARTAVELTALTAGFLLGGNVGIGTIVGAFAIGPMVQVTLRWFMLPPLSVVTAGEPTDGP